MAPPWPTSTRYPNPNKRGICAAAANVIIIRYAHAVVHLLPLPKVSLSPKWCGTMLRIGQNVINNHQRWASGFSPYSRRIWNDTLHQFSCIKFDDSNVSDRITSESDDEKKKKKRKLRRLSFTIENEMDFQELIQPYVWNVWMQEHWRGPLYASCRKWRLLCVCVDSNTLRWCTSTAKNTAKHRHSRKSEYISPHTPCFLAVSPTTPSTRAQQSAHRCCSHSCRCTLKAHSNDRKHIP